MNTPPSLSALVECKRIVEDSFPTSWLDPLLSGPRAIRPASGYWDGPAVEMLLAAVKDRLLANIESSLPPAPESAPDVSLGELPEPVAWACQDHHGIQFASPDRNECVEESHADGSRVIPLYALRAQSPAEGGFVLGDLRYAKDELERVVQMFLQDGCQCEPCPQCGKDPHDCTGTECAQTCDCSECDECRATAALAAIDEAIAAAAPTASALRGKEGG